MFLYNVTLHPPTGITQAIVGNFLGTKQQEILVVKGGSWLELFTVDVETGKYSILFNQNGFGCIRNIQAFRPAGTPKDFVVLTSDSGRVIILSYNTFQKAFVRLHGESYGKSGCRRIIPGRYVAVDPKGRALMIGAMEKQKLVYTLNRDASSEMTISSPLESHLNHVIYFALCSIDVGFENPLFATLEVDYEEEEGEGSEKCLTFYELDLGLNHVIRKRKIEVDPTAHYLIPATGNDTALPGVLVCSGHSITWYCDGEGELSIRFPQHTMETESPLVTSHTVLKLKKKYFFLLQTDKGDIFKLSLLAEPNQPPHQMELFYFDTVSPSPNICLLKAGFLFIPSDAGDHQLYQIESLGEEGENEIFDISTAEPQYERREEPRHLRLIETMANYAPLVAAKRANPGSEEHGQIFCVTGKSTQSQIRALRYGMGVTEMAVSTLPGTPTAVWTIRQSSEDPVDRYIVVSFLNATLLLNIGDTVDEIKDSGFVETAPTLCIGQMGRNTMVQVYPFGIRLVYSDNTWDWRCPPGQTILQAALNARQCVICLDNNEMVYFEFDDLSQQLVEYPERKEMSSKATCLCLQALPEGRLRAKFLCVGFTDNTVRVLSLDPDSCLQTLSMQALDSPCISLTILSHTLTEKEIQYEILYLNAGLMNGTLVASMLDDVTGNLNDSISRYLGALPVRVLPFILRGEPAMLAISSRTFVKYNAGGSLVLVPISYEPLLYGNAFSSAHLSEALIAVNNNTLRILTLRSEEGDLHQIAHPLESAPKRLLVHPSTQHLYTLETFASKDRMYSQIKCFDPMTMAPLLSHTLTTVGTCMAFCDFGGEKFYLVVGVSENLNIRNRRGEDNKLIVFLPNVDSSDLQFIHSTPIQVVPNCLNTFANKLLSGGGKEITFWEFGQKRLLRKCAASVAPYQICSIEVQGSRIIIGDSQSGPLFAHYSARDNVISVFADEPLDRYLTCSLMLDADTFLGADKFGNLFVSRLPTEVSKELGDEIAGNTVIRDRMQGAAFKLSKVIEYHLGDTVMSMSKETFIAGAKEVIFYATISGAFGLLIPFTTGDDVDFFSRLEAEVAKRDLSLSGRLHFGYRSAFVTRKGVIDGDLCQLYSLLPFEEKTQIAEALDSTAGEIIKQLQLIRTRVAY